jgi:xanthine/uracil/vitamin C permease (AzgA family)
LAFSAAVVAQESTSVALAGNFEVPAVTTSATGSGKINVAADRSVSGSINVTGIAATMAHLHDGVAGKNGPVVVTLTKASQTTFEVPAGTRFTEAQYASYLGGGYYVNVHSVANPSGELRGQLVPAAVAKSPTKPGY